MKYNNTSGRYTLLDELRGLDLVSMMLYHGCWDLVNLFGIQADWYYGLPGHLWQQGVCWQGRLSRRSRCFLCRRTELSLVC